MKKLCVIFICLAFVMNSAGCTKPQPSETAMSELTEPVSSAWQPDVAAVLDEVRKSLPDISSFPGDHMMSFKYNFPPVISATLYHEGRPETISLEDERLIRLLNYVLYSENEHLSSVIKGLLSLDDIQWHYDSYDDYLIVEFQLEDSEGDTDFVPSLRKVMIMSNCFLLFGSQFGEDYVEEHFPYEVNLEKWCLDGRLSERDFDTLTSDTKTPWINVLQISEFVNKDGNWGQQGKY